MASESRKESWRNNRQKKYKQARANGLCGVCGKNAPREGKTNCEACAAAQKQSQRRRYAERKAANVGMCTACFIREPEQGYKRCVVCRSKDKKPEDSRRWRNNTRVKVYDAYGGMCVCCGEGNYKFLTLDHKDNDGATHRKEIEGTKDLAIWANKNGCPDNLQLLCYNCNLGKARNGGVCPHEEEGEPCASQIGTTLVLRRSRRQQSIQAKY